MNTKPQKIQIEELVNSLTHGTGALLSAAGFAVLVFLAYRHGSMLHIVSCGIFGATLVLLYTASTLYHSVRSPRLKHILKIVDHSCIYLLIAGTYTPFTLVTLQGSWGWTLFGLIWVLAAAGIVFQIFFVYRFKILATIAYVLMGWLEVFAVSSFLDARPAGWASLAPGRGNRLHRRRPVLPHQESPLQPRHLAPLRARREHVPLRGCSALRCTCLRRMTGGASRPGAKP